MRGFWSWLGLNLGKRAGTVAIVGVLVTLTFGYGTKLLTFENTNDSYLNGNDPVLQTDNLYESLFGGDAVEVVLSMTPGHTVDNLFSVSNQRAMVELQKRLEANPGIFTVITPLDVMDLTLSILRSPDGNPAHSLGAQLLISAYQRDGSAKGKDLRLAALLDRKNAEAAFAPSQQVLSNPAYVNSILAAGGGSGTPSDASTFPNNTHGSIIIFLKSGITVSQEAAVYQTVQTDVVGMHLTDVTTLTTGVPAILETINNYLKGGMLLLGAIAAGIMVLILLVFFNVRWRLLPFAIVTVGIIWAFGLSGYVSIPIGLGSVAALPLLLGIGVDYSIQMHSRVEEEVVLDRAAHPIQATARSLGPALLVVTFDAVFACCALWFSKVPGVRQFGSLLVVGVIAVCFCSIVGTLAVLGIREYKSPTKGKDFSRGNLSRIVVRLGRLPQWLAIPLMGASLLVFFGGLASESHLVIQTDPLLWVNQSSPAVKDIAVLEKDTGTDDELGVLLRTTSPFSARTIRDVAGFSNTEVNAFPGRISAPFDLVDLVQSIIAVPGASNVIATPEQVREVYAVTPPSIQRIEVAGNGRYLDIIYRVRAPSLDQLTPIINQMYRAGHFGGGVSASPTGLAAVGDALVENLGSSRKELTYLAILFVGLYLAVRLRSFIRSLLSLIPVLIAVGSTALASLVLNLKLSPMTAVAGPLVVAVCTEFTSLILLRFVEERKRGLEPRDAMDVAAARTGRAFLVSAMTAVAGVGVLATSSMPLVSGFGRVVGLNVAVALLSALIVLPPILVWAEGHNWVSRGLMKNHEPPRGPAQEPGRLPVLGSDFVVDAGAAPPLPIDVRGPAPEISS